jgi:hypothetical protein
MYRQATKPVGYERKNMDVEDAGFSLQSADVLHTEVSFLLSRMTAFYSLTDVQ